MNKPFSGVRGDSASHIMQEVTDPKLAATIISIDVPLHPTAPMRVIVGDGIAKHRIIWQFVGSSPTGNTAEMVTKAWFDDAWIAKNSNHTLARIKRAFQVMFEMAQQAKKGEPHFSKFTGGDSIRMASTPAAATLVALGHECLGFTWFSDCMWWHFDRAAAVDLDLWMDREIHEKLPTADLSYIKAALLNWKQLLHDIKTPTHTAVKHKGRTAYVGKDDDQKTILTLEKLLYRK